MSQSIDIFCPVCKFKNPPDAQVCIYCKLPLPDQHSRTTTETGVRESKSLRKVEDLIEKARVPAQGISIFLLDNSSPIAILNDDQFVLGRAMEDFGERIIDLIPYGGFDLGVSRKHCLIQKSGAGYEVIDLDSTNGTWIQEQRLVPHKLYPLPSGSLLRLGRMKMVAIYQT